MFYLFLIFFVVVDITIIPLSIFLLLKKIEALDIDDRIILSSFIPVLNILLLCLTIAAFMSDEKIYDKTIGRFTKLIRHLFNI